MEGGLLLNRHFIASDDITKKRTGDIRFQITLNIEYRLIALSPDVVARRGLEPLISRMKTWRPNRLDERAKI